MTNEERARQQYKDHRTKYPQVYQWLVTYAREAKNERGYDKWSVYACVEIIRWIGMFNLEKDDQGYKINDHVSAYYSREIMMKNPDLYGFFECRPATADTEPLGPNGETWLEFEARKMEEELQKQAAVKAEFSNQ